MRQQTNKIKKICNTKHNNSVIQNSKKAISKNIDPKIRDLYGWLLLIGHDQIINSFSRNPVRQAILIYLEYEYSNKKNKSSDLTTTEIINTLKKDYTISRSAVVRHLEWLRENKFISASHLNTEKSVERVFVITSVGLAVLIIIQNIY